MNLAAHSAETLGRIHKALDTHTKLWYIACIMTKNTSITLGSHFEETIKRIVKSGRYASVSEVVRAGIRMVEEEERRIELLRQEIIKGEQSGIAEDFDFKTHLKELNAKYKK